MVGNDVPKSDTIVIKRHNEEIGCGYNDIYISQMRHA